MSTCILYFHYISAPCWNITCHQKLSFLAPIYIECLYAVKKQIFTLTLLWLPQLQLALFICNWDNDERLKQPKIFYSMYTFTSCSRGSSPQVNHTVSIVIIIVPGRWAEPTVTCKVMLLISPTRHFTYYQEMYDGYSLYMYCYITYVR